MNDDRAPEEYKKPWARALAGPYARWKLRRSLDGLHVSGLRHATCALHAGPVVFAANHVCFWDALVMLHLDQVLGGGGYALMDHHNWRRLPFLRVLGALPLDKSAPEAVERSLDDAARRLDRPGRALWIFPQGRQQPAHLRPLAFRTGVIRLARRAGVPIVPVAMSYPFGDAPQPQGWVRFAEAVDYDDEDALPRIERQVTTMLDGIDQAFLAGVPAEERLLAGRGANPERGVGARLLGGTARP